MAATPDVESHASSSSSATTQSTLASGTTSPAAAEGKETARLVPFEQRRVRHITSIIVRNLVLPDVEERERNESSAVAPVRPMAKRSSSIISSASTHTLRRSASNRTLRPRARRRASSAASRHMGERNDGYTIDDIEDADVPGQEQQRQEDGVETTYSFLTWEPTALSRAIHSRMVSAFVSLSRADDGTCFYRTPISCTEGMHHQWGRIQGSDASADGLELGSLNDVCDMDVVVVSLWGRHGNISDSTEQNMENNPTNGAIQPGEEAGAGFVLVTQTSIRLRDLAQVVISAPTALPPNSVLLGLSLPLANVASQDGEGSREKKGPKIGSANPPQSSVGKQQRYYLAVSETKASPDKNEGINADSTAAPSASEIRRKLKAGECSRAYDVDDVLRLLQLQGQIREEEEALQSMQDRCDLYLGEKGGPVHLLLKRNEERDRLHVMRVLNSSISEKTTVARRQVFERQEQLRRRRARLDMARRVLAGEQKEYDDLQRRMNQVVKVRNRISNAIFARRVTLLRQLEFIYPIELVDALNLTFSIAGIPLVNLGDAADDFKIAKGKTLPDDDTASSAFGMVAQMVALMSVYLDTPLHYPIATAGSRSVIQDGISVMSGPRAFPLFSKDVERYRFDYGHFLLNKDIEQLMNVAGLSIMDIRNTLPNLKNLIVTVTASDEPHSKAPKQRLVGSELIALKSTALEQQVSSTTSSKPALAANSALAKDDDAIQHKAKQQASSRFGMSLLGWGNATSAAVRASRVRSQNVAETHSSVQEDAKNVKDSPVPTVRALGGTTK